MLMARLWRDSITVERRVHGEDPVPAKLIHEEALVGYFIMEMVFIHFQSSGMMLPLTK